MSIMSQNYEPVVLVNPQGEDMCGHMFDFLEAVLEEACDQDPNLLQTLAYVRLANSLYREYQYGD